MSKYSEAITNLVVFKDDSEENLNIVQEAIDKAENYDLEHNAHLAVIEKLNLAYEQKEKYKAMVKKAIEENPLLEPYDDLLEENKILKDGVKAMNLLRCEDSIDVLTAYGTDTLVFEYEESERYNKIKVMLEVVENE